MHGHRSGVAAQLRLAAVLGQCSRGHHYQEVRAAIVVLTLPLARAAVVGNAGEGPAKPASTLSGRPTTVAARLGLMLIVNFK